MQSQWSQYWNRSAWVAKDFLNRVWTMDGLRINNGAPHTLWTFNSIEDLRKYKRGCDQENGGYSTVHLDLEESPEVNAPIERQATGKFWGEMRLDVKPSSRLSRGGFAMFRNKDRPTLFGEITDTREYHEYLALRVRAGGDPRTHNSYFVNLQIEEPFESTDLWQHRLFFQRHDNQWEDVFIPFSSFIRTNMGQVTEARGDMGTQIRSIGVSILGGHSYIAGKYELGIDSIRLVNEDEVSSALPTLTEKEIGHDNAAQQTAARSEKDFKDLEL